MFTHSEWLAVWLILASAFILVDLVCGWRKGDLKKTLERGGWSLLAKEIGCLYLLPVLVLHRLVLVCCAVLALLIHVFVPSLGDLLRPATVYIPWSALNKDRSDN